jgi:hypothetical protein
MKDKIEKQQFPCPEDKIGEVYTHKSGTDIATEGDHIEGWLQITSKYRVKVRCERISHSAFKWVQIK